jgi:prevent-host-death family protein
MNTWKLYDAKNQLSRLIEQAKISPQAITVRGKEEAVVLSIGEYRKKFEPKPHIVDSLLELGGGLDDKDMVLFERDRSTVERGTLFRLLEDAEE